VAGQPKRKPEGAYHHPDLEQALVGAAIKTISEQGIEGLTLRDIGSQLGVSRTAIYRHFADKSALLARVALEGFRIFRRALRLAVDKARIAGADPIEEMGVAYIAFAQANQSHYQTMFSGECGSWHLHPELVSEAEGAFDVLLSTIKEEQAAARISAAHDPTKLADIIWAGVHGLATLGLVGQLFAYDGSSAQLQELGRLQGRILLAGLRSEGKF
jgi:AcrR family transcriptional regulator